jgi:hypothetical protein
MQRYFNVGDIWTDSNILPQGGLPHMATAITGLEGNASQAKVNLLQLRFQGGQNLEQYDDEVCLGRLFLLVRSIFVHP